MALCSLPRLELEQRCRDFECRLQTASVHLQREKSRRKDSERKVALLQDAELEWRHGLRLHLDVLKDSSRQLLGGMTLWEAVKRADLVATQALLFRGARVSDAGLVGSPVHYAAREGQVHILRVLADAGADLEAANALGHTPLHLAASRGHVESCRLLLERGAEPTITDDCGGTPLHYAAGGGHLEVVELLVEYGAPVDARTEDDGTPLHWAAGGGHLKVVWFLVQSEADVTVRDCNGRTPEDVAQKVHTYVADWLRDWQRGNVLTVLSSSGVPTLETSWRWHSPPILTPHGLYAFGF